MADLLARTALRLRLAAIPLDDWLCEIRFVAPDSGRQIVLPMRYARFADEIIMLVHDVDRLGWWQAFGDVHPAQVLLHGHWYQGLGRLVGFGQRRWLIARYTYRNRFPALPVTKADAFVVITLRPTEGYELVPDELTALHVAPA